MSSPPSMEHNNPHRLQIPLYCSQSTQTQPESDYDTDSSDFPPYKIGRSMSPASAMRRNPPPSEEPPQPHLQERRRAGLGQTNLVNTVHAARPTPRRKVTGIPCPPLFRSNRANVGNSFSSDPTQGGGAKARPSNPTCQ